MIKIPREHPMKDYGKEYLMYHHHYQRLKMTYRINISDMVKELNIKHGVQNYNL